MTDSLVARLREAIDETEQIARAAGSTWSLEGDRDEWLLEFDTHTTSDIGFHDEDALRPNQARHIARHDPASVLRRCAADRKILDAHAREHDCIELTASGDASLIDGKPWELWEATDRDSERSCFVVRTLAEAYGVEA